jgi:hypothetical protein
MRRITTCFTFLAVIAVGVQDGGSAFIVNVPGPGAVYTPTSNIASSGQRDPNATVRVRLEIYNPQTGNPPIIGAESPVLPGSPFIVTWDYNFNAPSPNGWTRSSDTVEWHGVLYTCDAAGGNMNFEKGNRYYVVLP